MQLLAILRHAEKDPGEIEDPGLSFQGTMQAAALCKYFRTSWNSKTKVVVLASPKKRSVKTAEAIASAFRVSAKSMWEVDEREPTESGRSFERRVKAVFDAVLNTQFGMNTIIVSHADWLDEFCSLVTPVAGVRLSGLNAGAMHVFEISDKKWTPIKCHFRPS